MKKTLLSLAVVSLLSADTTMCFKENWTEVSKIESVALSGGKCKDTFSVNDMTTKGWRIDDMKISSAELGMNYIYIFKNGSDSTKKDIDIDGEKLYKASCIKCHGATAQIEAFNTSRALNTMTKDEIEISIREYQDNEKDNGRAILMIPYATKLSSKELKAVISYIKTFK